MSYSNLMEASRQWSTRPDDERFESIEEMDRQMKASRARAREYEIPARDVEFIADGDEVVVVAGQGQSRLSHYAFEQAARYASAPVDYLRELPSEVAASCLTHSTARATASGTRADRQLMIHETDSGRSLVRGYTSDRYARVWNADITDRLGGLAASGWRVPPARPVRKGQRGTRLATEKDVIAWRRDFGGLPVKVGDEIAPAGLYGSPHDMFAFMVDPSARIEDGSEGGLMRGFFVRNSEVGAGSLSLTTFLLRGVCGNHIVWGAQHVVEFRSRHVGDCHREFDDNVRTAVKYVRSSTDRDRQLVLAAQNTRLGRDVKEVVDALFKAKITTRKNAEYAYALADKYDTIDGDPRSAWGIMNGITRLSQLGEYADERTELDRAAGRVLELVAKKG